MEKNIKHSIDFITKNVSKKTGFSTPKNYFDDLESNLLIIANEYTHTTENNFDVPEGYFDTLEDAILNKINSEKKSEKHAVKVIPLRKRITKYIPTAVAASLLLFIATYIFTNRIKPSFDTITGNEIESWFENNYTNNSSNELALLFTNEDFTEEDELIVNINDDNLTEYLNTIDDSNLIEELQ